MKKLFLLEQPPLTTKFRLIVDDLTDVKNFGYTNDIDKIEYNLNILGKEFIDKIDLYNLFSTKGLTSVFPVGTYIAVLERNKDKTEGKMSFFDFDNIGNVSEFRNLLEKQFSESIIKKWFEIYYLLSTEFSESEDLFELIRIEPN